MGASPLDSANGMQPLPSTANELHPPPRSANELCLPPRSAYELHPPPRSANELNQSPRSANELYQSPRSANKLYQSPRSATDPHPPLTAQPMCCSHQTAQIRHFSQGKIDILFIETACIQNILHYNQTCQLSTTPHLFSHHY